MSDLGDRIIEHGPFTEPLRLDGFGYDDGLTDYRKLNELREELIELREAREIIAKAEDHQCGCLGGPLTIEWASGQ